MKYLKCVSTVTVTVLYTFSIYFDVSISIIGPYLFKVLKNIFIYSFSSFFAINAVSVQILHFNIQGLANRSRLSDHQDTSSFLEEFLLILIILLLLRMNPFNAFYFCIYEGVCLRKRNDNSIDLEKTYVDAFTRQIKKDFS